jgi:inosine-uridine nucleoside N-ribohydrolase
MDHHARTARWRASAATALLLAALLSGTVLSAVPASAGSAAGVPAAAPAVVVDTDMDFDDTAALAFLAEADKLGLIDLRAVAVEISGVAFAGNGLSHARCLLDKLGLPQVPVSDGDTTRTNNFPAFARTLLDGIVESGVRSDPGTPCPAVPTEGHAADLLASAIRSAPGEVTLVTLGPLTTVAETLARDPLLAAKIGRVFLIGGTLDWSAFPTSGLDTHDYNLWVDPPAAQAVLDTFSSRVFMTSHEATKAVPLTEAFRQRLGADRTTPAADSVYTMASNPLLVGAEADNQGPNSQGVAYWWDPLNAVAATVGGVVSHQPNRVSVIQSGDFEGRLIVDERGPLVHYGTSARTDRFEQAFLDVLNGRLPLED